MRYYIVDVNGDNYGDFDSLEKAKNSLEDLKEQLKIDKTEIEINQLELEIIEGL